MQLTVVRIKPNQNHSPRCLEKEPEVNLAHVPCLEEERALQGRSLTDDMHMMTATVKERSSVGKEEMRDHALREEGGVTVQEIGGAEVGVLYIRGEGRAPILETGTGTGWGVSVIEGGRGRGQGQGQGRETAVERENVIEIDRHLVRQGMTGQVHVEGRRDEGTRKANGVRVRREEERRNEKRRRRCVLVTEPFALVADDRTEETGVWLKCTTMGEIWNHL